ncbi:alpha/beta hydrolase [Actinocrispum sp. NPDC049592]|uniref:alpha/beta hydrolase n=1 Tax=Actinocrispum sp. NPDC049592 TaxID=3154835 RepID=UPI003422619F
MRPRRTSVFLTVCVAAFALTASPMANAGVSAPVRYSGVLANGATWTARVPASWNGSLVLFSHGFRIGPDNPAVDAPDEPTAEALLERGFALAGSSYARTGWAVDTAVADQLDTVDALGKLAGRPREVIAFGQSMGGLVSALLAERGGRRVDGALTTCGLVAGALNLNNHQLDGTYAVAELLLPGQRVQLTGFTTFDEANATVAALTAAVRQAQTTPAGRARIALAAALMNMTTWSTGGTPPAPEDWNAQQQAQYEGLLATLPFVVPARVTINAVAGGDSSWNAGVDYRSLASRSGRFPEVSTLYRQAGLDLARDLDRLTRGATIKPDFAAVRWLSATSVPGGRLAAPELTLHTLSDTLAPVEFEREYAGKVVRAGGANLLRQAYVSHIGHCAFTPAEHVAGLLAVHNRIRTGTWGNSTEPRRLQQVAQSLGLGPSAFVTYRPEPFVNDRADRLTRNGGAG